MKKFEFTGETKAYFGRKLHRIRALTDIKRDSIMIVKAGKLGGWLEKEENLSQYDKAWVSENAKIFDNARIYGNAWIFGDAQVYNNARICDDAMIFGRAIICCDARVYGNAQVYGDAQVYGNAHVHGTAEVSCGARICDNAMIFGDARVCDDAMIYGNAHVYGYTRVHGNARICDDAIVKMPDHYLTVGPIGSRNDTTTFFRNANGVIKVKCGCFLGTIDAFLERVARMYGNNKYATAYRAAAALAVTWIDTAVTEDSVS